MKTLHYAHKDLDSTKEDIPKFEFNCYAELNQYIDDILESNDRRHDIVYLFTSYERETLDINTEPLEHNILVSSDGYALYSYVNNEAAIISHDHFFLQEYCSYESAYKVALQMKETNPLCYED